MPKFSYHVNERKFNLPPGFVVFSLVSNSPHYAWLYTPEGTCNISLAKIDNAGGLLDYGVMLALDKQILLCGGYSNNGNCFLYDVQTNQWSFLPIGMLMHSNRGTTLQGKIYLTDSGANQPEVCDSSTKTFTSWSQSAAPSTEACFVSWNGFILQLGAPGSTPYVTAVQKYNPKLNNWSMLQYSPSYNFFRVGCLVLPNNNILITGVAALDQVAEYNVSSNTWTPVVPATATLVRSNPVLLGSRVLVIPGSGTNVVHEYFYTNRILVVVKEPFTPATIYSPVCLAVPASWFTNLLPTCFGTY